MHYFGFDELVCFGSEDLLELLWTELLFPQEVVVHKRHKEGYHESLYDFDVAFDYLQWISMQLYHQLLLEQRMLTSQRFGPYIQLLTIFIFDLRLHLFDRFELEGHLDW